MRGRKGNYYDGGHRVPFFIRWPQGGLAGGKDIEELTCHIDLLPTLADLCELDVSPELKLDGRSLSGLLSGELSEFPDDRIEVLHIGRSFDKPPDKWSNVVLSSRWRLVHGCELYDIKKDPGQRSDVAAQHPDVVERLRRFHEAWWESVSDGLEEPSRTVLGSEQENPTKLSGFDVMGDAAVHQSDLLKAQRSTGKWAVFVEQAGRYRIALRRWPPELGVAIRDCISDEDSRSIAPYGGVVETCTPMAVEQARLTLFDTDVSARVHPSDTEAVFELDVDEPGETTLEAWFTLESGEEQGVYYVCVQRLPGG
jgi:hypothetical protein